MKPIELGGTQHFKSMTHHAKYKSQKSEIRILNKRCSDKLSDLGEWLYKFQNEVWDKQFERNVKAGKLDKLAEKAISDYHAGKCKEL